MSKAKINVEKNQKHWKKFWTNVGGLAKDIDCGRLYKIGAVRCLLMNYEVRDPVIHDAFKDFGMDVSRTTIREARKSMEGFIPSFDCKSFLSDDLQEDLEALDDGELKEPSPPHPDWETLNSAATFVREVGGFEAAFKALNTVRNLQIGQTNTA